MSTLLAPPLLLALILALPSAANAAGIGAPAHGRPFLMPPAERERVLGLAARDPWAADELARLRTAAAKDGYAAAFVYALEGGEERLAIARRWLLDYGAKGGDIPIAKAKLDDPAFFAGGQPWISPVYYNVDVRPLVAYDWVYAGLTAGERAAVEGGILTSARFRVKCMDRWTQTPNLVFKPTVMVALAGLVTQDRELMAWGFDRKPGSRLGGYFPVLDVMLDGGGPWREAPIYPVAHRDLELMGAISRLLRLYDGIKRFGSPAAGGGSPRALADYFLDTAYPPETGPDGKPRIRVLTYGDGATSAKGDLFLAGANKGDLSLREALAESWAASGDGRYAAFLALGGGYRAALPDRPPLPREAGLPPAPSKVWESFGLAFLRSDETAGYWRAGGGATAASLLMSQGYGHDHRDKLGITFFGAGRLRYPDWNHEQYENAAVGWTRNTIAHNALMVDEEDARDAPVAAVRSEFAPGRAMVAVAADGVYPGVRQERALVLTGRYLLDVVTAASARPRTWDWLLHAIGTAAPGGEGTFAEAPRLGPRYARMRQDASGTTDGAWSRSFLADDGSGVRVLMAPAPGTQVVTGVGHDGNAMVVARRAGVGEATFVAVHEAFAAGQRPTVRSVAVVGRAKGEIVVRVSGDGWAEEQRVPVAGATPTQPSPLQGEENGHPLSLEGRGQGEGGHETGPRLPRLRSDYSSPEAPLYRVEAAGISAGLDMRTGLVRHLADPEGRDRLGGAPLFTFAAEGRELLSERTVNAFTWPVESPASLVAEVESKARYRVVFFGDRMLVGMDRDWTQARRVAFTIPGGWRGGEGARWAQVSREGERVAAAELAFPDGAWSLCFELVPPQEARLEGAGMSFEIGGQSGESWTAGFCRRGGLAAWRWPKPGEQLP